MHGFFKQGIQERPFIYHPRGCGNETVTQCLLFDFLYLCVQLASIPDYVHSQKEETAINLKPHCEIDRRLMSFNVVRKSEAVSTSGIVLSISSTQRL